MENGVCWKLLGLYLEPPMQKYLSLFVEINRLTKNHVILVDSIKNLAFRKNITGTVKQRENNWNDKEMGFAGVCGIFAGVLRVILVERPILTFGSQDTKTEVHYENPGNYVV